MRERVLLLLMAIVSITFPAAAVDWRQVGPDGGTVTAIAAAMNERMLLAGTAEGLLFRSVDGAQTWERAGAGLGVSQVRQIIVDPHNASRVWVGTDAGIFRSSDHGGSFLPQLAGTASRFAVAPASPDVVYAAMIINGSYKLLKSVDGGATWTPANGGLPMEATSVAVDAVDPSIVYVSGYNLSAGPGPHPTLWRSSDGGASWQPTTVPGAVTSVTSSPTRGGIAIVTRVSDAAYLTSDGVTWTPLTAYTEGQVAYDPSVAGRVYFGWFKSEGGFSRSDDGGGSVRRLDGLQRATNLVVDPSDSNILYAGTQGGGVLRSDDAGQTATTHSVHLIASEMKWLAADPGDSNVLYAGGNGALFRTADHGVNWTAILPSAHGTPLTEPWPAGILAVDPHDSTSLWAISEWDQSLWHSSDTGGSWQKVNAFHPSEAVSGLAVDRNQPNTIWLALAGSPDRGSLGQVYKSVDGGVTFANVSPSFGAGDFIGQLVLDPTTPGRVWISGTHAYSSPLLYLSSDGGQTWTNVSASLADGPVTALVMDPDRSATVYAAVRGPNANDTVPRLFRSDDAGRSWQTAGAGLSAAVSAIDPSLQVTSMIVQRGLLYAAFGQYYFYGDARAVGGILVSSDRGASWSDLSGAIGHRTISQLLAADPVIVSTVGQGIFVQSVGARQRVMHP